jgi:hypothetical protein
VVAALGAGVAFGLPLKSFRGGLATPKSSHLFVLFLFFNFFFINKYFYFYCNEHVSASYWV